MKRLISFALAASVALALTAIAQAAGGPTIVMPGQGAYVPAPPPYPKGTMMAVLSGDPAKAGAVYTVRLKLPDGIKVLPHTHGDTENVTVVSGTLMVGVGKTFDVAHMKALPPGSFVSIPAGLPHYGMAKGNTVLQVTGLGPSSMTLVK